ncbi:MAG: TAXI family TRAP transporter solute-binding subunit [Clostridia bacterium]|jgi:TRAP transporter TAXI family solute receptor|nr:TAXI family TRAP transporter solute-binding subunit [Clostridia bacterium]MDH7573048.1 TAXI family TRAP transporter solute-binding subunit [Clostridia bacterium]
MRRGNKRLLGALLSALLLAMLVSGGCGKSGESGAGGGQAGGAVVRLSLGTGGTGGTYYPYGAAVAKIINNYVPGVEATAEVTGASVENLRLVGSGEIQMGLAMDDAVYHALKGIVEFNAPVKVYTLFEMYPHFLHMVALHDTPVDKVNDLRGKKVSVGAPGSGTEVMSRQVLESLGITYNDFTVHRLSFSENTEALRDNVIDVGIWSVGPPTSSIMDLATTHKIKMIGLSQEEIQKVTSQHPYYHAMELPAGTYRGVDSAVPGLSVWNTCVVSPELSEDMVYSIVKALFEHVNELIEVYPGAKWTTPESTVKYATAPLHPGVVKYFREIGIEVPERLLPEEVK